MSRTVLRRFSQLMCALCLAWSPATNAQNGSPPSMAVYASPQQRVQLPDGRRINLVCEGAGSPTVLLTAGLSDWAVEWFAVQPEIAKKTRVCAWDRAGFGFSDPRPEPLDIARSSDDLAAALAAARIRGPYVVVGHSMGGLETLIFADRHRKDIAGIVLVDPTIPGQYQRFGKVAPNFSAYAARGWAEGGAAARACANALRSGTAAIPSGCPPIIPPTYPPAVIGALNPLLRQPERVLTQSSMIEQMAQSTKAGMNPHRNYGDLPLIVLSAAIADDKLPPDRPSAFTFPSNVDPRVTAEIPSMMRELSLGHDGLAALSSRGSKRIVRGVGHRIPLYKPDLVISATLEVIEQARSLR